MSPLSDDVVVASCCSRQRTFSAVPLDVVVVEVLSDTAVTQSVDSGFTDVGQIRLHDSANISSGSGPSFTCILRTTEHFYSATQLHVHGLHF